jgi:hypothetical protein
MPDRFMGLPWEHLHTTGTPVVIDRTILEESQIELPGFDSICSGRLAAERAAAGGTP